MQILKKTIVWKYRVVQRARLNYVPGEHEIRLRLTQMKEVEYLSTGYSSSEQNWDHINSLPSTNHPHYLKVIQKIEELRKKVDVEITIAEREGRIATPIEIKERIETKVSKLLVRKPHKIIAYTDMVIENLEEEGRIGYANIFTSFKSTLNKLLNNQDRKFISFNKEIHERYEKQISNGKSQSTISNYLRTYYRIWNLAIKDGLCPKQYHPSNFIQFKPYKRIRTKKRAIKSEFLQRIFNLKLPKDSRLFRSQKILQFIYYSRGINFADVCKLKWEQIQNEGLSYKRSKNRREYNFELHRKSLAILTIFKQFPVQSDAGYVFPFLMSYHDNPKKIDARIDSALKDLNEDFKLMSKAIGWEGTSTSYALRHGFATHLRNSGIDISIIKAAMGHETEHQTQVYLDDIDDSVVADAINSVLE